MPRRNTQRIMLGAPWQREVLRAQLEAALGKLDELERSQDVIVVEPGGRDLLHVPQLYGLHADSPPPQRRV